jgi:hypothetical protein
MEEIVMATYEFTLQLDQEITAEEADALYGVFHDGSIVTGAGGTEIEFTREAPSLAEAIVSAIRDIESVGNLRVTGAGQEALVSMLDIGHRTRRSREAVRLWAAGKRGPGGFPPAAWESPAGERFWHWPDVARWVREHLNLAVDIEPDEIRWVDEILKARQALAEAQRILKVAPDATRDQLGPLLQGCLQDSGLGGGENADDTHEGNTESGPRRCRRPGRGAGRQDWERSWRRRTRRAPRCCCARDARRTSRAAHGERWPSVLRRRMQTRKPGHPLAGLPHVRFAASSPGSRAWCRRAQDIQTTGAPMTAPEHFRRAEELAAKASEYLGHEDARRAPLSGPLWNT